MGDSSFEFSAVVGVIQIKIDRGGCLNIWKLSTPICHHTSTIKQIVILAYPISPQTETEPDLWEWMNRTWPNKRDDFLGIMWQTW